MSSRLNHPHWISTALFIVIALVGCRSPYYADRGAAAGGLAGAGVGALVGNAVGSTVAGTAIGAGVGALTGVPLGAQSMTLRLRTGPRLLPKWDVP
jgi:hypothetical protein